MKYTEAGTYELKYKAIDECGNESEQIRIVNVTAPPTKATVLFDGGTLVINELSTDRARHIQMYGPAIKEYPPLDADNPYIFSTAGDQLWASDRDQIAFVRFGSAVAPTSMAYWFQKCTYMVDIHWENFDGSQNTSLRATFAGLGSIKDITLPPMPNVNTIQYMCQSCDWLESIDFSNLGAMGITNTTDAFQGCTSLKTISLVGLGGTVDKCERMFANVSGGANMTLETIYSDGALKFYNATSSTNMFRSCTSLVGGKGTAFNSSVTNKDWARIDNPPSEKGYFTQA